MRRRQESLWVRAPLLQTEAEVSRHATAGSKGGTIAPFRLGASPRKGHQLFTALSRFVRRGPTSREENGSVALGALTRALSATPRTAEEQTAHALIGGTVVSEARKPPFSPAGSNRQPPFLQPFRMRSQASRTASR
jgi:hypothetical protein